MNCEVDNKKSNSTYVTYKSGSNKDDIIKEMLRLHRINKKHLKFLIIKSYILNDKDTLNKLLEIRKKDKELLNLKKKLIKLEKINRKRFNYYSSLNINNEFDEVLYELSEEYEIIKKRKQLYFDIK